MTDNFFTENSKFTSIEKAYEVVLVQQWNFYYWKFK